MPAGDQPTSWSAGVILRFRLGEDPIAEVAAQRTWRVQVHRSPQNLRELFREGDEGEAGHSSGLELDEDVDVAVGSEVGAEDGSEEGQAADAVATAKRRDLLCVNGKPRLHPHDKYTTEPA